MGREMSGSFLTMTVAGNTYQAKVMEFSSDLSSNINSVQTQRALHHFPFKVTQPSLSMTLQMRGQVEATFFQTLVRLSQAKALTESSLVNLFWPQRGIMDWRGVILSVQVGERVGQTAPIIMIEFLLVDSHISERTWTSSAGSDFDQIYAGEIPDIPLLEPNRVPPTNLLKPPRRPTTSDGKPIQGPFLAPDGTWR